MRINGRIPRVWTARAWLTRQNREDKSFRSIFQRAGLQVVRTELQKGLPEAPIKLFPIRMYALKPAKPAKTAT